MQLFPAHIAFTADGCIDAGLFFIYLLSDRRPALLAVSA